MEVSFKIIDSVAEIEKNILEAIRNKLDFSINKAIPSIKKRVQSLSKELLIKTPEFQSIYNNQELNKELGLSNPQDALNQILTELLNGIEIIYDPIQIVGRGITGGITVGLLTDNLASYLNLPGAKYRSGKYNIPWLEWLLLHGDSYIITSHRVIYGDFKRSRSGYALMIESKGKGGWRIPPQFSGIQDNNFLTRAFTDNPDTEQKISTIIEEQILIFLRMK